MLKTGDAVFITYDGRTVGGIVKLASPNGQSIMLEFEAILGGMVGLLPALMDDAGVYRDLLHGQPVTVTPVAAFTDPQRPEAERVVSHCPICGAEAIAGIFAGGKRLMIRCRRDNPADTCPVVAVLRDQGHDPLVQ